MKSLIMSTHALQKDTTRPACYLNAGRFLVDMTSRITWVDVKQHKQKSRSTDVYAKQCKIDFFDVQKTIIEIPKINICYGASKVHNCLTNKSNKVKKS